MLPPKKYAQRTPAFVTFLRSTLVAVVLINLLRIAQPFSYGWTIFLVYFLIALGFIEVSYDEAFHRATWAKPVGLIVLVAGMIWFSVGVTFAKAPLEVMTYVEPDHGIGTEIGGISWDEHFTDLRIALTNRTDDDYSNLDIVPKHGNGNLTHRAAILDEASGCSLSDAGGDKVVAAKDVRAGTTTETAVKVGNGFEVYDNTGNSYTTLATRGGYRLICGRLPARFTVRTVFAIVTSPRSDMIRKRQIAGGISAEIMEMSPIYSVFAIFGPKPSVTQIALNGKYSKGIKPHSVSRLIEVTNLHSTTIEE